jgi:alkylation response protein AidB-like acyl-CoA dehydrogenase
VATGEWLATMCLTEPHAGSDLGLARTKAVPQADGSYRISGTKIFISGGEHDLSDNIVHLVLARLPDAPPGPKGLSLFLVPKFYADGSRSEAHCERIEEKMGLHGSPTCVMRFDEAVGWIVGEPGRGLSAMFVMMNAARLHVALQGIGLLDAAWQKADAYSKERRQMRAPGRAKSAAEADLIAEHPAMRRILDSQRAWIDGGRLLAYRTALELDIAKHHPDAELRAKAQRWCSLATPVIKAAFTHQAFYGGSECLQVFGGHGYVREWGVEQNVRDSRVAMIYEGTNEIQAIDLLVRKVVADGAEQFNLWMDDLRSELNPQVPADARVLERIQKLHDQTQAVCLGAAKDATLAHWVADDYLRAVAVLLLDWAWAQIAREVQKLPPSEQPRWSEPAKALQRWVVPELDMRLNIMAASLG